MAIRAGDGGATVRTVSLAGPVAALEITLSDGTTVDVEQAHHLHDAGGPRRLRAPARP